MIYVDSSVAVAHLLAEDRKPDNAFWDNSLISSRLLEYEVWVRLNKMGLTKAQDETVRALLGRFAMVELIPEIIARAREKFPADLRTLDALHLASATFLVKEGVKVELATYDDRMVQAARQLRLKLHSW